MAILLDQDDIIRLPGLLGISLKGTVEADHRIPTLTGVDLDPVLFAFRSFSREIDIHRAVTINLGIALAVHAWKWLLGLQLRTG